MKHSHFPAAIKNKLAVCSLQFAFLPLGQGFLFAQACSSCGSPFTDARDGKTYNTVLIGSQCWMKENLNYGTYAAFTSSQAAGTKFCQNLSGVNDPACPFGGLYEWANLMNGSASCNGTGAPPNDDCATPVQGLCPAGWHIPSHYEWTTLEKNVGSNPGAFPYDMTTGGVWLGTDEGGNLKQTGTTNWITPNTGATNSSGFTALPGGYAVGMLNGAGGTSYWWSSTSSGGSPWFRRLIYNNAQVFRNIYAVTSSISCRCVCDGNPLPVELLYFNAAAESHAASVVRCDWATASESNNDYFGIERSQDGIAFAQIATAPSKAPGGNSSVTLDYEYDDPEPYKGVSYYRLRQVDFNGTFTYSEIRAVYIGTFNLINIYPNPAAEYIEYLLGSQEGGAVTITLYDALGREVYNKEETIGKGLFKEKIETSRFGGTSGNYLLRITNGNLEKTQKQFVIK